MRWHQVTIEIETGSTPDEDALGEFMDVLEQLGAGGPAVGGTLSSVSATFSLDTLDALEAATRGRDLFLAAIEKSGLPVGGDIMRLEVLHDVQVDRDLNGEPEQYLGVTEIAELLGVSRQRVSELRGRPGFPEPIAELAAGPVWALSHLRRFLDEWPRRAGRAPSWQEELDVMRELNRDQRDAVLAYLETLPTAERDIVDEVVSRGTTFREIASQLGITSDAARLRFRRALVRMRNSMVHNGLIQADIDVVRDREKDLA